MCTKTMNIALMVKWVWKICTERDLKPLWLKLIHSKYLGALDLFSSNAAGGFQFWHNIHKIKNFFKLGAKFLLGTGTTIRFWEDWWIGESPLSARYPRLFEILARPDMFVSQAHNGQRWRLSFRHTFGDADLVQWHQLIAELDSVAPSDDQDSVSWAPELSGQLSVASLYRKILHSTDHPCP